jgi:hypothetical protein
VTVSFHDGQITEIVASFAKTYWDEMVPIFDKKYGADWKVEREDMVVTDSRPRKVMYSRTSSCNTSATAPIEARKTTVKSGQPTSTSLRRQS